MIEATPRAARIVDDAIGLGQTWSRHIPSGARIHARAGYWHHAEELRATGTDDVVDYLPAYDPAEEDLNVFAGAMGISIEMHGDVDLSASEADLRISPALALTIDAAVAMVKTTNGTYEAAMARRELRGALEQLGYLRSELIP